MRLLVELQPDGEYYPGRRGWQRGVVSNAAQVAEN